MALPSIVPALLALSATLAPIHSGDTPSSLPVEVAVVTTPVTDAGTFRLRLACTPLEDLSKRYGLRVALTAGLEDLLVVDHDPDPPTAKWRAGGTVDLALDLALPPQAELAVGELVSVRVGFLDAGKAAVLAPGPDNEELADEDGLVDLAAVEVPPFAGAAGAARLEAVFASAGERRAAGDAPGAWALLVRGLRDARDDDTKRRFRDALTEIGRFAPAPPDGVEEAIVARRIRAEQARYFRLVAGRMHGRGALHGALRLLEEAGGALSESADEAVIGAVNDAERVQRTIEDIEERLLTELTGEQEARVAALVDELGRTEALFERAERLAAAGERAVALALYRKLRRVDGVELYDRAQERLDEVGPEHLAATPPEQQAEVDATLNHPAWGRLTTVASHAFLFIGPKRLVEGIPADSKLRFDLAYVFVTDLFGRLPNPEGDRITVFFKELWDFGGGVGGGKIIDIGRAEAEPARAVRVDNGLLYHELTHCVDDTNPIFAGFREGLANVGAAYAYEALGQDSDALHSFDGNLAQFRKYFLERDLAYWRIQNYGPSAGFFLHFVETYAKRKQGHDWSGLRRFFREYREAPVRDGREPYIVRALAHYLVRAFGPPVFDDLLAFRFPLDETDRRLLARELERYAWNELDEFAGGFAQHPNCPLPRDLIQRELAGAVRFEDRARAEELRGELGIVFDWKVIGPFFAKHADPGACAFPPELEIDFKKKPQTWRASRAERTQRFWQDPIPSWVPTDSHKNVTLFPSGWIRFDYRPYGDDNSAIYALTHVMVAEAVDAVAHVRADDDVSLFVNDRRVVGYRGRGRNASSEWLRWRGPYDNAPDGMVAPVRLEAGRNKVLVKIRNRGGTAGLVLAFAKPDGSRLAFTADNEPPDPVGARAPVEEPAWKRVVRLDSRSYKSKAKVEVGGFRTRNKAFHGTSTEKGVKWRLFTVRPGFPKDSPSNLLWIKESVTKPLEAVRVDVELASKAPPKLLVTLQGEGEDDGLSGWNLILVPRGKTAVEARLERYDTLVYASDPVELADVEGDRALSVACWDGWVSASLDGEVLLERVSIDPIPGKHRIGLATWGPTPELRAIELSRGR